MRKILIILLLLASPGVADDNPARDILEKNSWKVESEESTTNFELPKKFGGIPWLHYQQCSLDAGLDLTAAAGKTIVLKQFLLTQRGGQTGANIRAAVALFQGRVIGAWLHTDAPVAPGLASIKDHDFPTGL